MKIFVTGAAGFIGHRVVLALQDMGHDVYSCDSYQMYQTPHDPFNISKEKMSKIFHERIFNFHHIPVMCDINERYSLMHLVEDIEPDIFIHLAAMSSAKLVKAHPKVGLEGLTSGLFNAISAAIRAECKMFTYISSSTVYGKFTQNPQTVLAPCSPTTMYGHYKLAGETMVAELAGGVLPYTILRPCAVYGPYDAGFRVIERFLMQAARNLTITVNGVDEMVDFTYIDDCVSGIIKASLSEKSWYSTYNISSGKPHTLLEAASLAKEMVGSGVINITVPGTVSGRGRLDIAPAQADFGYDPQVDLAAGMRETWTWMQQQRWT